MSAHGVHERLRQARTSRGEELPSLARRIGVRRELLQAIEDGRFADLPSGIYGRAAIRAYSASLALDPNEILAACEPLLPALEDPIRGLGRLKGIRSSAPQQPASAPPQLASAQETAHATHTECPSWRLLAAATIDAVIVLGMVLALVGSSMASGVSLSALSRAAAAAFVVMGVLMGGGYFVLFGGIAGATVGDRVAGLGAPVSGGHPVDLRTVASRALRCAARDVSFIELLGSWLGSLSAPEKSSESPPFLHGARL